MTFSVAARGLLAGWFCSLLPMVSPSTAAEPSAESAHELVRQALRAELVGDKQLRRQRLEGAAALDPEYGPAQWQLGKVRLPGQATWQSAREMTAIPGQVWQAYSQIRDEYVSTPEVIWSSGNGPGPRTFRLRIALTGKPHAAEIRVVALRPLSLAVNGNRLKTSPAPGQVGVHSVAGLLKSGDNTLAIHVEDADGPTGLIAWGGVTFGDDRVLVIRSGAAWQVHAGELADWSEPFSTDVGWLDAAIASTLAEVWETFREPILSPKVDAALARWCRRNHLDAQSRFHWSRVLEANASNKEAIKSLDLVREDGLLWTRDEVLQRRQEEKEASLTTTRWKSHLARLQKLVQSNNSAELSTFVDESGPDATAAAGPILAQAAVQSGEPRFAATVIELIERVPEPAASRALADVSIFAMSADVRNRALASLKERDSIGAAGMLLPLLHLPLQIQIQRTERDAGSVYQAADQIAFRDRRVDHDIIHQDVQSIQIRPVRGHVYRIRAHKIDLNHDGKNNEQDLQILQRMLPSINANLRLEAESHAAESLAARETAARALVDSVNLLREQVNLRSFEALEAVTGQNPGRKVASWWDWWRECNSLMQSSRRGVRLTRRSVWGVRACEVRSAIPSCFIAGTPVWTRQGLVPVEQIHAGDEVLSQDPDTGELAYKIVTFTTIRPPSPVLTLTAGGDSVTTTLGHRFWRTGAGWIMAKQVSPGIPLHQMGGSFPLDLVAPAGDAPAYNLVVDDFHTYFVGQAGWLVHDNRLPAPGNVLLPGLLAEPGEVVEAVPGCGLHKALINATEAQVAN